MKLYNQYVILYIEATIVNSTFVHIPFSKMYVFGKLTIFWHCGNY